MPIGLPEDICLWPSMGFVASHPFRKERGMDGARKIIADDKMRYFAAGFFAAGFAAALVDEAVSTSA